jgi:G:T-mismatch repair DNA endonuclease (very short patch repair protein)
MKWKKYGDPLHIWNRIAWNRGKPLSEEAKKKLSEINKGNKYSLGRKHTEESKKRMSEAQKKRPKISEATRKKLSESAKNMSKETREKISKTLTGRKRSDVIKKKISESLKGQTLSEVHKKKISESSKGKKMSESAKKKMSESGKISANRPEKLAQTRKHRATQKFPFKDTKIEVLIQTILEKNNIDFVKHKIFKFEKSFHPADIVIEPDKVIEVNGDYWHFNPKTYDGEFPTRSRQNKPLKAKDVWKRDKEIIDGMKQQGYKVLVVWESELNNELEDTTKKILEFAKS